MDLDDDDHIHLGDFIAPGWYLAKLMLPPKLVRFGDTSFRVEAKVCAGELKGRLIFSFMEPDDLKFVLHDASVTKPGRPARPILVEALELVGDRQRIDWRNVNNPPKLVGVLRRDRKN